MVNNRTLLSTKEKENLLIIILVFLLSLSWWAILQLLFLFGHVTQWCFDFWDFFWQCFPSKIQKKYSVKKFLAFFQNFTSFSRKNIYKKNLWHTLTQVLVFWHYFRQFSTFRIHHLLFGEFFFTKFQPEKCDFRPIQTWNDISWESGPNILDFEGKKPPYHQIDGWIIFFKTLTSTVKPKAAKKKTDFWMFLTLTTQIW